MIIATFVRKETEVGIMIVHHLKYGVGTEVENLYILTNTESIGVGNIIVKLNGSNNGSLVQWIEHLTTDQKIRVRIL